ncbi:MAG: SDR family NAD(P)-dependent oxidoreductase, partial [Gemmatimonadota bacterium]|nr:SDR family NAD(P)-dependent oxidoreductase [Gemmatimonadota bacterium]
MKELEGQVTLVTGGSRGIGLAIAQELARAGAVVAVVARNGEPAAAAAASLEGSEHRGYACDVSEAAGVKVMVAKLEEELGPVDTLVNNAGITRDNIFIRMKEEEWDEVLAVNL